MMSEGLTRQERISLRRVAADQVGMATLPPRDSSAEATVAAILDDVRRRGSDAVRDHARRLGDLGPDDPWIVTRTKLDEALDGLDESDRSLLARLGERIRHFAQQQLDAFKELQTPVLGGVAGHRITPVATAGCYAPGGRFPLPSTVMMTAVTARVAGVSNVWVASPKPTQVTLAAAALADADALLAVGGAQAIAAFAYGAGEVPPCDVVVGPGNRWVTTAKALISQSVRIDVLAGPSELTVLADRTSDPELVAADLLAQAEHDPDATSVLVSTSPELIAAVETELARQLRDLPTAPVAAAALRHAVAVPVRDLVEAVDVCNRIAPEHLQIHVVDPSAVAEELTNFGALFVGAHSSHVFGDYGAGPNHVLPTSAGAKASGGLSVLSFLKVTTWLQLGNEPQGAELVEDAARLARLEGLEAHARAAELRARPPRRHDDRGD